MNSRTDALRPEEIYYRIHGDPSSLPPIVLLHGVLGFSANWGKIWPHFSSKRQVLVFDQRGHGRSPKPPTGYSPGEYSKDLLNLLNEIGWQKVHLVGHSMGGRVAIHFAHDYSERLVSLVLEDSGAEARPDRIQWIKGLLNGVPTPFPNREAAKHFFDKKYAGEPMLGGFLHANLVADTSGQMDWRFYKPGMIETIETGRANAAMEIYCNLKTPTLLIRGENSVEFTKDEADRMIRCRKYPTVFETIRAAGHWVHADQPQEFCLAVEKFIKQIES